MTLSNKAFVLAAGKGVRLRPLTETCPKPLLEVGGAPMIDRVLDSLAEFGVEEAVVNLHYLGDMLEAHLSRRSSPKIILSKEETLLDLGGGVKNALPQFGDQGFFVLGSDVVWTDNKIPALRRLADQWDPEVMDILLLLVPMEKSHGYTGLGDYFKAEDGRLTRRQGEEKKADYMFTSLRILHPRIFENTPDGAFPLLPLFDKAEKAGRLFGAVHDGEWFHVGTPDAFTETDRILRERAAA